MAEWLDSERNGEKPADRYNIDEAELRKRDEVAREEYEKQKKEGERKSIEAGKKSQRAEAKRIGGKALRSAVLMLLGELGKEVMRKFISWLKSAEKTVKTLLGALKDAVVSFVRRLDKVLVSAGSAVITTVATAIWGPIVRTIKKAWVFVKQGFRSLKEAIDYIRNPQNRKKSFSVLLLEVSKIAVAGASAAGAIALGEVVEKGLMTVPFLAFEIPILGSLASLLGLFIGGLVAGIIGALALSPIDKAITNIKLREAGKTYVAKASEILGTQEKVVAVKEVQLGGTKGNAGREITRRHKEAGDNIQNALIDTGESLREIDRIVENVRFDGKDNAAEFEDMEGRLKKLTEDDKHERACCH